MSKHNSNLCSLWESLILDPAKGSELLDQETVIVLLNHAGVCVQCSQLLSKARNSAAVYDALASVGSKQAYEQRAKTLITLRDSNNEQLEQAVTEVLLPSLPSHLRKYSDFVGEDIRPNQLYLAGEAISMMLHRIRRQHPSKPRTFLMNSGLTITGSETRETLPTETVIGEVRNVARVNQAVAVRLAKWVLATARVQSKLMVGVDSRAQGKDSVLLFLTKRNVEEDLATRWSPARVLVEV